MNDILGHRLVPVFALAQHNSWDRRRAFHGIDIDFNGPTNRFELVRPLAHIAHFGECQLDHSFEFLPVRGIPIEEMCRHLILPNCVLTDTALRKPSAFKQISHFRFGASGDAAIEHAVQGSP
jgi:hypothetical protein